MDVRWLAVIIGFVVDTFISGIITLFASPSYLETPDLSQPSDLTITILLLLSTGIGGYIAGRIAARRYALHGLLVGVVGILVAQLPALLGSAPGMPRLLLLASAVQCLFGAAGGALVRLTTRGQRAG